MSDKLYDKFKDFAQIWIPALSVLVLAICEIWGLPMGKEISATLMAIDTFLGAVLKISSINYYNNSK